MNAFYIYVMHIYLDLKDFSFLKLIISFRQSQTLCERGAESGGSYNKDGRAAEGLKNPWCAWFFSIFSGT